MGRVIRSLVSLTIGASVFLLTSVDARLLAVSSDSLSLGLTWLTGGAILVCYIRGAVLQPVVLLWWTLLVVLMGGFIVNHLLLFYLLFEISLIPILLIIIIDGSQPERIRARAYLLLYTGSFSVPYLLMVLILLPTHYGFNSMHIVCRGLIVFMIISPFLVKMPVLGLHFWLPKAHVEASTTGSIVLAGLLLKLGSYGVVRVILLVILIQACLCYSGVWLALRLLARAITILQSDLKKLVAYRSVTHITFIVVALITRNKLILLVILILSLAHGWCSMGMFYGAGTFRHINNSRIGVLVNTERGLYWLVVLMGGLLILNASVPPMPSFFSEAGLFVITLIFKSQTLLILTGLRFTVCYYNAYILLWISHTKGVVPYVGTVTFLERTVIALLLLRGTTSVLWVSCF